MEEPKLDYPREWEYKIIGYEAVLLESAAAEVIFDREYQVSFSKKSSSGKYISLNIKTLVKDQADRDRIFTAFSNHPSIKTVI